MGDLKKHYWCAERIRQHFQLATYHAMVGLLMCCAMVKLYYSEDYKIGYSTPCILTVVFLADNLNMDKITELLMHSLMFYVK